MKEKLLYLLSFLDAQIDLAISEVLADSEDNPEFSAVTAKNLIICYIEVMQGIGEPVPFTNVEEYMSISCYTQEEILLFQEKARKESVYYIGKQY